MNGDLRKVINVKICIGICFTNIEHLLTWELYRKHRNHVVQLGKKWHAVKSNGGKDFWKLIKPLISNKSGNK